MSDLDTIPTRILTDLPERLQNVQVKTTHRYHHSEHTSLSNNLKETDELVDPTGHLSTLVVFIVVLIILGVFLMIAAFFIRRNKNYVISLSKPADKKTKKELDGEINASYSEIIHKGSTMSESELELVKKSLTEQTLQKISLKKDKIMEEHKYSNINEHEADEMISEVSTELVDNTISVLNH